MSIVEHFARTIVLVFDTMKGCFPELVKILTDGVYCYQKLVDATRQKLNVVFSVLPLWWM